MRGSRWKCRWSIHICRSVIGVVVVCATSSEVEYRFHQVVTKTDLFSKEDLIKPGVLNNGACRLFSRLPLEEEDQAMDRSATEQAHYTCWLKVQRLNL